MPKKQPEKAHKGKKQPEANKSQEKQKTEIVEDKSQEEEIKPKFQDLLSKEEEKESLKESSLPGGSDVDDENILEICREITGTVFEIWHRANPKVEPLSEFELKHITQPLSRIVVKYDVAKYMKDEFLLCTFLGFAIYKRVKVKKDDKDDNREKGTGKDHPDETPDTR